MDLTEKLKRFAERAAKVFETVKAVIRHLSVTPDRPLALKSLPQQLALMTGYSTARLKFWTSGFV